MTTLISEKSALVNRVDRATLDQQATAALGSWIGRLLNVSTNGTAAATIFQELGLLAELE